MLKNNFFELNTARNCLRVIIRCYKIKEIFIPYYICPTVWQACRAENCSVKFYHIDDKFYPIQNFDKNSFILYPNYFGICSKQVFELAQQYPNLIVDNAHALFMKQCGLASFSSYRKFFEVADGAKLYMDREIKLERDTYIYKKLPQTYAEYVQNELRLNREAPKLMSNCTKNIIDSVNFDVEKHKRLISFQNWHKKLKETNKLKFELTEYDVPFVYPYLSDKPLEIETFRYWNVLPESFSEYKFYKFLQPIPLVELPYLK